MIKNKYENRNGFPVKLLFVVPACVHVLSLIHI